MRKFHIDDFSDLNWPPTGLQRVAGSSTAGLVSSRMVRAWFAHGSRMDWGSFWGGSKSSSGPAAAAALLLQQQHCYCCCCCSSSSTGPAAAAALLLPQQRCCCCCCCSSSSSGSPKMRPKKAQPTKMGRAWFAHGSYRWICFPRMVRAWFFPAKPSKGRIQFQ